MAKKRERALTVKMPEGPKLAVDVDGIVVPPGKQIDLAFPVVSEERRQELDEIRAAPEQAG